MVDILDEEGMSVSHVRYLGRDGARGAGLALASSTRHGECGRVVCVELSLIY